MENFTLTSNLVSLNIVGNKFNRIHVDENLKKMKYLNASGCRIQNMYEIIVNLDSPIKTLDASFNFIGKLNHSTFAKLNNLEQLILKSTNLSNIQYSTFHHQRNLKTLDISYNNLKKVNFSHLRDTSDNLQTLHVDGNQLNDLNDLRRSYFQALRWLGLSNNSNFSCDYLSSFMKSWKPEYLHGYSRLVLVENIPVTDSYVDGIDCNPHHIPTDFIPTDIEKSTSEGSVVVTNNYNYYQTHNNNNQTVIILLSFMCIVMHAYFLIKFVKYLYLKRHSFIPSIERNVIFDKEDVSII